MTARRPSKPWRVTLTSADATAETPFASAAKAYAFARGGLSPGSPAHTAKIMQWEDGRWWHYETLHREDVQTEETP